MTRLTNLPIPEFVADAVWRAYAEVGCTVTDMSHEVDHGLGVGTIHMLRIDMTGWGESLHGIDRTETAMLSLHHLLIHQHVPAGQDVPEIAELDEDHLRDLVLASIGLDVESQRRLRDVAASLGHVRPIPLKDDGDIGPIVIDRHVASLIAKTQGGIEDAAAVVPLAAITRTPVDRIGDRDREPGPHPVHRYSIVCADAPRLLATIHLVSDRAGEPTVTYDGFTIAVRPDEAWPETLLLGLPGRRLGDVVETGHALIDDRLIEAVETDAWGVYQLHLEPDAVMLRELVQKRS